MKYMENPDIAFKSIDTVRRAHCLYTELAAETGFLGMFFFLSIVITLLHRLWRLRAHFARNRPDLAYLASGFWLGIVAYMVTGIFLQLAYQRYLWLYLGLAGAAIQIFEMERRKAIEQDEGTSPSAEA
jgi:O-antigen ligase